MTLLGDAIHTMSPGRGEGANVALRDAGLLRRRLVDVVTSGVPLAQAKAAYETEPFIRRDAPGQGASRSS